MLLNNKTISYRDWWSLFLNYFSFFFPTNKIIEHLFMHKYPQNVLPQQWRFRTTVVVPYWIDECINKIRIHGVQSQYQILSNQYYCTYQSRGKIWELSLKILTNWYIGGRWMFPYYEYHWHKPWKGDKRAVESTIPCLYRYGLNGHWEF